MVEDSSNLTSDPLVSVVIPAFNCASTLARAVESVIRDSFTNTEIVIVDDGSTDETSKVIEELMRLYPARIFPANQANLGGNAARNKGLDLARGKFIQFLDADDYLINHKIALSVAAFDKDADLHCVYTDGCIEGNVEQKITAVHSNLYAIANHKFDEFTFSLNTNMPMFRRSFLVKCGERWDEDLKCWQESEFFFRLMLAIGSSDRVFHISRVGFARSQNAGGVSSQQASSHYLRHKANAILQIHQICIDKGLNNARLNNQVDWFMWSIFKSAVLSHHDGLLPDIIAGHVSRTPYQRVIQALPADILRFVYRCFNSIRQCIKAIITMRPMKKRL